MTQPTASVNGQLVVAGCKDGRSRVWDAPPESGPVQNLKRRSGREPNESHRDRLSIAARHSVAFCLFAPAGQAQATASGTPSEAPRGIHNRRTANGRRAVQHHNTQCRRAAIDSAPGLVRKSAAYWSQYKSDIIRQVFDGGFGEDVDEDADSTSSSPAMWSSSRRVAAPMCPVPSKKRRSPTPSTGSRSPQRRSISI